MTELLPVINSTFTKNAFGIMIYANSVSEGLATPVLVFSLGIIFTFLGIQTLGKERGVTIALFVTWFLSILLNIGGALNPGIVKTISLIYLLWLGYLYMDSK